MHFRHIPVLLFALTAATLCRSADFTVETVGAIPRICIDGNPAMLLRTSGKRPQIFIGATQLSPEVCRAITENKKRFGICP